MSMESILKEGLKSVQDSFSDPNELAYLALTGKVETQIRDRLAFSLHCKLYSTYMIAREWNRCDLAILDKENSSPIAFIELKALHSADICNQKKWEKYKKKIEYDRIKSKNLAEKHKTPFPEIYTILLATHTINNISTDIGKISKYRKRINNALSKYEGHEAVRDLSCSRISNDYPSGEIVVCECYEGGSAWGIACEVLYWLLKA
ncbi:MAG: hypothetical protein P1P84_08760 [Deferrisomatales bacterium]|nr:hypothetical protein [Deferrisomatales bacterium]